MSSALNHPNVPRPFIGRATADDAAAAVHTERVRIARDLHDAVGHSLATISLQAGVAAHIAEQRPEAALAALESIRTTSRDVLDEIRAILGQLREDDAVAEPARGIGTIDALVEATRNAGVRLTSTIVGRSRPLLLIVDQTAYRIVQESLTNILRHAYGATAYVAVAYEQDRLVVTVENDGTGRPSGLASNSTGYGIRGMRERARQLGGDLEATAHTDGSFRVQALLPFRPRP
jgi:signal transduction histidine kinase